jgi:ribosomal protein L37AE/L43A
MKCKIHDTKWLLKFNRGVIESIKNHLYKQPTCPKCGSKDIECVYQQYYKCNQCHGE